MSDAISILERVEEAAGVLPPEARPDVSHIITEDESPVDNLPSEKQQRLLTEPLYSSWEGPGAGRPFLAAANVGLFAAVHQPPLVPDMFLSLDVEVAEDWWAKKHRSYFFWEFGKPPDVVIEIVSNRQRGETGSRMHDYARLVIPYYVIFDPLEQVQAGVLRAYALSLQREYEETTPDLLEGVGLGFTLWRGVYEGKEDVWLRWQDAEGNLILTGAERAEQERRRAEGERRRAEQERRRAEEERQRAEEAEARAARLAAQLRALGVEPQNDG